MRVLNLFLEPMSINSVLVIFRVRQFQSVSADVKIIAVNFGCQTFERDL